MTDYDPIGEFCQMVSEAGDMLGWGDRRKATQGEWLVLLQTLLLGELRDLWGLWVDREQMPQQLEGLIHDLVCHRKSWETLTSDDLDATRPARHVVISLLSCIAASPRGYPWSVAALAPIATATRQHIRDKLRETGDI